MSEAFSIDVPLDEIEDLRHRLRRTRWPDDSPRAPWEMGTDSSFLRDLVRRWADEYNWQQHQAILNEFHNYRETVHGQDLHFIHEPGVGRHPVPLLLLHGAFSNFYEFHKVVAPLSDPGSFGGDPSDCFDVVVMSLPGFGFSAKPRSPGMNLTRITDLAHDLMTRSLGYPRFGAGGGSWGGLIASRLGASVPDSIIGLHLTQASPPARAKSMHDPSRSQAEAAYSARVSGYVKEEAGYQRLLSTRPDSVAFGLNDSPAGLAAWYVEKIRSWSDCDGDLAHSRYSIEELLTMLSITWFTGTVAASQRLYYESANGDMPLPADAWIDVPTGVLGMPFGMPNELAPPEMIERTFDLRQYRMSPHGGHFPAMDASDTLVESIRDFFRAFR